MMMNDKSDNRRMATPLRLLRGLRPALPAVIGAAALTFLFVAIIPMAWIGAISWNLYLDRLSDLFVPPVGNSARLALALGMAGVAALIAAFVALLLARPEETGLAAVRRHFGRGRSRGDGEQTPPRRRADRHPDDPLRPPINAARDLPPEGLGPLVPSFDKPTVAAADTEGGDAPLELHVPAGDEEELLLADIAVDTPEAPAAPVSAPEAEDIGGEDAPWLQPAQRSGPARPDPADHSLGAMVARLEAGLSRRRTAPLDAPASAMTERPAAGAATATSAAAFPPAEAEEGEIDFALEAALGTLERMNRRAVG